MTKALITGGSGYFGSLLINKLLEKGVSCASLDINDANDRPESVEFIRADIRDLDAVKAAVAGVDVVFHNVAQVPLAKDVELFESVNGLGTENILKAAYGAGVNKLVYTSSSAVFGVPDINPVTEDTQPKPGEEYGLAKYKGELMCHQYQSLGLDVSIIRPRTIMGHGRLGIFQILFEWIAEGYNVPVLGDGNNVYQFVHSDDLAEACILAGNRSGSDVFNCGAAVFGTMRNVLEDLCDYAQTGSKVKSVPMTPAVLGMRLTSALGLSPLGAYHSLMYGRSMYFDISKAQKTLNWNPRYSNAEMFIESYEWYLKNRELVLSQTGGSHHRSAVKQGVLNLIRRVL
jgi:nucleoside-diphosphate-sugar epimerase